MTLPQINFARHDAELQKFALDGELGTVVKVLAKIFGGEITILAPDTFKVHTILVTDVAQALTRDPGTIATDVRNLDETNTVYGGPDSLVQANDNVGTTAGWQIGPSEGDNVSLQQAASYYVICKAGKTVKMQVRNWIKTP